MKRVVGAVALLVAIAILAALATSNDSPIAHAPSDVAQGVDEQEPVRAHSGQTPETEPPLPEGTVHRFDVTDAAGRPLRGARIRLFRRSFDWRGAGRGWRTSAGMGRVEWDADSETISDAWGRGAVPTIASGVYDYDVSADGYARKVGTLDLHADSEIGRTTETLFAGHGLSVQLTNEVGEPVSGREIVVGSGDLFSDENAWLRFGGGTDRTGRFAVSSLATGVYEVWTWDPSSGHRHLDTLAVPGVKDVSFVIQRGPVIRGRVLDAGDGEPIPGARIGFSDRRDVEIRRSRSDFVASTDEEGGFEAHPVGPVAIRSAIVHAPGRFPVLVTEGEAWSFDYLHHPEEHEIVIAVPRLARVKGVVHGPDGPIPGARVDVGWKDDTWGSSPDRERRVTTDSDGRYDVSGVPPGYVRVIVWADGFAPSWSEWSVPRRPMDWRQVETESDALTWDVVLESSAEHVRVSETFRGRVVCADGRPAAGARVWLTGSYRGWHVADAGSTVAGPDGCFEVVGEANAGSFRVYASLAGEGRGDVEPDARDAEVVVTLGAGDTVDERDTPNRHVHGVVRRPDGSPAGGVEVAVAQMLVHGKNDPRHDWDAFPRVRTAEDGTFSMQLPVGRYGFDSHSYDPVPVVALSAIAAGHSVSVSASIDLRAVEIPEPLELTLFPGHALEGVVVDATGDAVPDARVTLSAGDGPPRSREEWRPRFPPWFRTATYAITDAEGRFRVPGLAAETYEVTVEKLGHYDASAEVTLPSDEPLVVLSRRPCALSGRVVDEAGTPLADVEVVIPNTHGRAYFNSTATTDAKGRFTMKNAPDGAVRLRATPPEDRTDLGQTVTEEIVAPESDIKIVLGAALMIEGVVRNADGEPMAGVWMQAWPHDDAYGHVDCDTDQQDRFRLTGVGPGSHDVLVLGGPEIVVHDVEVGETLDIAPEGDAEITGVTEPFAYGGVRLTRYISSLALARRSTTFEIERDGSFRATGLAPGRYRLELGRSRSNGRFTAVRTIDVTAPSKGLDLTE